MTLDEQPAPVRHLHWTAAANCRGLCHVSRAPPAPSIRASTAATSSCVISGQSRSACSPSTPNCGGATSRDRDPSGSRGMT